MTNMLLWEPLVGSELPADSHCAVDYSNPSSSKPDRSVGKNSALLSDFALQN